MNVEKRVKATVLCGFCRWRARMTGDTPTEVAEFLRSLVDQHVAEQHAGETQRVPMLLEREP